MNPATCHGPGDQVTWGPCVGHPLDPRNDFPDTCWMDEEDAETRRSLLAEMDKAEVISDALFLRSEAEIWRRRCGIAELKLEETRRQLAAALKVKA